MLSVRMQGGNLGEQSLARIRILQASNTQYAHYFYRDVVDKDEQVKFDRLKVMFVGGQGVGKTSALSTLFSHHLVPSPPTVGLDIQIVNTPVLDGVWMPVDVRKLGNQTASYDSKTKVHQNRFTIQSIFKLIAANSAKSKSRGSSSGHQKKSQTDGSLALQKEPIDPTIYRKSKSEQATSNEHDSGLSIQETQEMKRMMVQPVCKQVSTELICYDFSGHRVFQPLHHPFLTDDGLYLVFFSAQQLLESGEEQLKAIRDLTLWLQKVQTLAPNARIMLIGTFFDAFLKTAPGLKTAVNNIENVLADRVFSDTRLTRVQTMLYKNKDAVIPRKKNSGSVYEGDLFFFPLSNETNFGIVQIKEAIKDIAISMQNSSQTVPISWIRVADEITNIKQSAASYQTLANKKIDFDREEVMNTQSIDLTVFQRICSAYNIAIADSTQLLRTLHTFGLVSYLENCAELRDRIIIDSQCLYNKLTVFLRDNDVHEHHSRFYDGLQGEGLMNDYILLNNKGYMSLPLFNYFFTAEQDRTFTLQFLKANYLLLEARFMAGAEYFVIPAKIPASPPKPPTSKIQVSNVTLDADDVRLIELDFSKTGLPKDVPPILFCHILNIAADTEFTIENIVLSLEACSFKLINDVTLEAEVFVQSRSLKIRFRGSKIHVSTAVQSLIVDEIESLLGKINTEQYANTIQWSTPTAQVMMNRNMESML